MSADELRPTPMRTEREKMLAGELYDAMDAELVAGRPRARELCQALNASPEAEEAGRRGKEYGAPVAIGTDVWVGAGALVLPGVRIGDRAVIGAGSVVTRDVPADVLAVGNPCRIVRPLGR